MTTNELLAVIDARLAVISDTLHRLTIERTRLLEAATPLRMGVLEPESALVALKASGVTLRVRADGTLKSSPSAIPSPR